MPAGRFSSIRSGLRWGRAPTNPSNRSGFRSRSSFFTPQALVARGLNNREIAEELVLSPATARTHVSRAMTKLGARDRAQLVVLAYEIGLVTARP